MRFVFPSEAFRPRAVDSTFAPQFEAAQALGHPVSLLDEEAFEEGQLRLFPCPQDGEQLVWRGWMLTPSRYQALFELLRDSAYLPLVEPKSYQACHWLPEWYPLVECTAQTEFCQDLSGALAAMLRLNWGAYFVKDYVKSLNLGQPPIVTHQSELIELVAKMEEFRGQLEGGLCLRKVESFEEGSERRLFVYRSHVFSDPTQLCPAQVLEMLDRFVDRVPSPFFSVDVARRVDGVYRVVELGDGQVSDVKHWLPHDLYQIFGEGVK